VNRASSPLSARARLAADSPISELMHTALTRPELISLAAGFVDQASLPVEAARTAALALFDDPELARAALQYGTTAGNRELRERLLTRVRAADGGEGSIVTAAAVEQVVLAAGSNQILYLVANALLDPGDIVLCDAPSYFVFTGLVRMLGARCVGVRADAGGLCLDALEEQLERCARAGTLDRVKAIYVVSYFDNPRALCLEPARRARVVELARRYSTRQQIYVIEDAAYRELAFKGEPAASVWSSDAAGDCVLYAGTFSKSFAPGVRVGFGILPRALVQPVLDLKGNLDFGAPNLNQCLLLRALQLGLYEPHAAQLRAIYARKAAVMCEALDRAIVRRGLGRYERPAGGLYVWLELPDGIDTGPRGQLLARALEEGVLYVPGTYFFPEQLGAPENCMRLSFGVQSDERIVTGIEKLARAVATCR
jgi:2-aminoadipate transaminase